jgi:hypothetical protein
MMPSKSVLLGHSSGQLKEKGITLAENRTRVDCLEGSHANHYTTIATRQQKLQSQYFRGLFAE